MSLPLRVIPEVLRKIDYDWNLVVVFHDANPPFFSVGVGDFSVWEFSGNPVYFCCYDYFAANDPTSIHVIVFSLEEPYEIQLNQVIFWLSFLKSLVPVEEPIGEPGGGNTLLTGLAPRSSPDPVACGQQLRPPLFLPPTRKFPLWKVAEAQLLVLFCRALLCKHVSLPERLDSEQFLENYFSLSFYILELQSFLCGAKWTTSFGSSCTFT